MEAKLFNNARIKDAAQIIGNELLKILANRFDGQMSRHVAKTCPSYNNGLTNGERLVATIQALSTVQLEIVAHLSGMTTTVDEDLCDDDETMEPAEYAPDPTWKCINKERYDDKRTHSFPTSTRESIGQGGYDDSAFLEDCPADHDKDGRALYVAFLARQYDGITNYFESDAPMSVAKFQGMSFLGAPHPKPEAATAADAI